VAAQPEGREPNSAAIRDSDTASVVSWLRENAVPLDGSDPEAPFDDLERLAPMLGDARVIALGEGTHGTHEFLELRHRFAAWLGKRNDLGAVVWEAEFAQSLEQQDRLNNPAVRLSEVRFFRPGLFDTKANAHLVAFLREYNESRDVPVLFAGADTFDLNGSLALAIDAGRSDEARAAASQLTRLLGAGVEEIRAGDFSAYEPFLELRPQQAMAVIAAAEWLYEAMEADGEHWSALVAANIVVHRLQHLLQFAQLASGAVDWVTPLASQPSAGDRRRRVAEAADRIGAFLEQHDPAYWAEIREVVRATREGSATYADELTPGDRFAWDEAMRGLVARFEIGRYRASLEEAGQTGMTSAARTLVDALDHMHADLRSPADHMDFDNHREIGIGGNLALIAHHAGGDGRVLFAAHNGHIGYWPKRAIGRKVSGAFARDALQNDYLAIGTMFGRGEFQAIDRRSFRDGWDGPRIRAFQVGEPDEDLFESVLMQVPHEVFAVDLRAVPEHGPVAAWFGQARPTRMIGNAFDPDDPDAFIESVVIPESYDILIFFRTTRRALPTDRELRRGSYDLPQAQE
jgi:erythromycin esterase-like protein